MEHRRFRNWKETAKNQVISVGGGTPVREENRTLMKEIGKGSLSACKKRKPYMNGSKRYQQTSAAGRRRGFKDKDPGTSGKRSSAYEEAADLIIDVDDKPFGQVLYEIERGIRPSYRDNANTASEEGGYKGKYSQRYPLGQRFGYGTRAPYGKPSYGTFGSYGQSAAGSRFYPADVLRMMDTLKGIYRHWQTPVRQKKRLSPMDLSPMGSPLMGSRQRAVSSFTDSSFPVRRQKKKKKSLCASFWSSTVPT